MDAQIDTLRMRSKLIGTMWSDVVWFDEIDSTNRWLVDEANAKRIEPGTVAIAGVQSAGRGRLGRTWTAPAGSALLMSMYVVPDVELEHWPLLTFAVAMAVRDSVAGATAPGTAVGLKWPNDVIVEDGAAGYRKLCGVLAEATPVGVVIGCGVNLIRPSELPPEYATTGARPCWISDHGSSPSIEACATDVLLAVHDRIAQLGRDHVSFLTDYRSYSATLGANVRVHRADGSSSEVAAVDVDDAGRLVIFDGHGHQTLSSGDVEHVRPVT